VNGLTSIEPERRANDEPCHPFQQAALTTSEQVTRASTKPIISMQWASNPVLAAWVDAM
jgi:hypothetical protein